MRQRLNHAQFEDGELVSTRLVAVHHIQVGSHVC